MEDFPGLQKCRQHVSLSHFKFGKLTRLNWNTFSSPVPRAHNHPELRWLAPAHDLSVTIDFVGVGITSLDAGPKSAFDVTYHVFAAGQATPGLLLLLYSFPLPSFSYHRLLWWTSFLPYWHYKLQATCYRDFFFNLCNDYKSFLLWITFDQERNGKYFKR